MLAVVSAVVLVALLAVGGVYFWNKDRDAVIQRQLDVFYTPPSPVQGHPGDVIRSEPAPEFDVPGSKAYRMLYVTESMAGGVRASSGMFWIPTKEAKAERKVIAWAHPTVGLGTSCVPSRNPGADGFGLIKGWLQMMAERNWVVTATDYAGLGTPPPYTYLLGQQEALDVVNSVRAVRNVADAHAGKDWGVFGHSQGGQSALFTGKLAKKIAPELNLVGVAAAAPAAELPAIIMQQWNKIVAWVIGPEVVLSWPTYFPELRPSEVLTRAGLDSTQSEALDCLTMSGIGGMVRQDLLKQQYFSVNPLSNPDWKARLDSETSTPLPKSMPVFLGQGTADEVVMANTNALMQVKWCKAGSDLTVDWLGGVSHQHAAQASGPAVTDWFEDRFAGLPTHPNCKEAPAVAPYPAGANGDTQ